MKQPDFEKYRSVLPAALLLLAAVSALAVLPAPDAGAEVVNRIVLRVNDRIATLRDYELRRDEMLREISRAELPAAEREEFLEQMGVRIFRDIYEELLLLSRADQLRLDVADAELNAYLDQMRERMGIETPQEFAAAIAQSGMRPEEFRERMRHRRRMQRLVGTEVHGRIEIEDEDLRRIYRREPERFRTPERIRVRDVVVLEESGLTERERHDLAQSIRDAVAAGASLEEVAAEHSEQGTTSGVIEIGWVEKGDLERDLEQAVWGLAPGYLSGPVEGRGGTHVLEVVEREEATLRPFEEVADRIHAEEQSRLFEETYAEYLEELEESAYVDVDPPPEAEGFRAALSELGSELESEELEAAAEGAAAEAAEDANAADLTGDEADGTLEESLLGEDPLVTGDAPPLPDETELPTDNVPKTEPVPADTPSDPPR